MRRAHNQAPSLQPVSACRATEHKERKICNSEVFQIKGATEQFEIIRGVEKALHILIERDSYLLFRDVHERSISHRLAIYIESEFPGWHVDCEYNRLANDPKEKQIEGLLEDAAKFGITPEKDNAHVLPDIIVHHRGKKDENLLAIEIKKNTSPDPAKWDKWDKWDKCKLSHYKEDLKYKYAYFISLSSKVPKPSVLFCREFSDL